MKNIEDRIKEKINIIEKRVVELKFIERDVKRERDIIRFPLLEKGERCSRVDELIQSFFVKTMKLDRSRITVTAFPSGYSGRDEDEFLSEIKVEMKYRPESPDDYSELSLTVYLVDGFEDRDVRQKESEMMNRLLEAREEVERLREEKRTIRNTQEQGRPLRS